MASNNYSEYFNSIGIKGKLREHVDRLIGIYEYQIKIPIESVVVSEYVLEDGGRVYESLWLFTHGAAMEVKDLTDFDSVALDFAPTIGRLRWWGLTAKDYDFEKATSKSRLTLEIRFSDNVRGTIKASAGNCEYLVDIVRNHLVESALEST